VATALDFSSKGYVMRKCRPFNELKRAQQRRRMRQAEAFSRFVEYAEEPIRVPVPEHETPEEKRVRILSDLLERCRLLERAGPNVRRKLNIGDSWLHWTTKDVEDMVTDAKRELRISRGDF
jgi:hypothetical protein